ncbi:MAG: UDP-N-acetylmuramoyl-tripeptide--D-alanyl-D-alanine ligase [bacterium]
MITLTAEEAGRALGQGPLAAGVPGVSIDSRSIRPGELFVALPGERFDGHDFVGAALVAGASGAVVEARRWAQKVASAEHPLPSGSEQVIYRVADTLAALGALARTVRRKSGVIVVAITGSVGKTSTKDLLGAMARRVRRVVTTAANQNNEVGVPLTLLAIEPGTQVAIVEMGMRGRGQIAALARLAEPDVGLITNIHPVHLELLGTVEDIAEAKAELLTCLTPAGVAVIPVDCRFLRPYAAAADCRVVGFGLGPGTETADVHGSLAASRTGTGDMLSVRWPEGEVEIETPFASGHRLENAVAAAAACYAAGLPVDQCVLGMADVRFSGSRGDVMRLGGLCLINDTYNASPAAVRAALDDLVDLAARSRGRPVAVLGDMLELGPEADRYHREIGAYAAEAGVRALWGVGPLSRATVEGYRKACESRPGLEGPWPVTVGQVISAHDAPVLMAGLRPGDVVLFKASRSMKLEIMVNQVVQAAEAGVWGELPRTGRSPDGAIPRPPA